MWCCCWIWKQRKEGVTTVMNIERQRKTLYAHDSWCWYSDWLMTKVELIVKMSWPRLSSCVACDRWQARIGEASREKINYHSFRNKGENLDKCWMLMSTYVETGHVAVPAIFAFDWDIIVLSAGHTADRACMPKNWHQADQPWPVPARYVRRVKRTVNNSQGRTHPLTMLGRTGCCCVAVRFRRSE